MELLEGDIWTGVLGAGGLPLGSPAGLGIQLADALDAPMLRESST